MADEQHLAKLKEGVEAWDQWREENPDVKPDFSEAYLFQAHLSGANLRGANLSRADLSYAHLFQADVSGADLFQAYLERADFCFPDGSWLDYGSANLSGLDLRGANLSGADFTRAWLLLANLRRAQLGWANLEGANDSKASLRIRITLKNCDPPGHGALSYSGSGGSSRIAADPSYGGPRGHWCSRWHLRSLSIGWARIISNSISFPCPSPPRSITVWSPSRPSDSGTSFPRHP